MPSSHSPSTLVVAFDDDHAVANAGLLLPATLAERLGIEEVVDALVDLGGRPGAHRPGRKVLTLIHAIIAGADCIDDAELLRTGSTALVLSHRVMAPSTLGTFLRSFTFGHVRQLDRVAETLMGRAWAAGAGPGDGPMIIDLDSTICEVHSHHKGGRAGASGPLVLRADSGFWSAKVWPPAGATTSGSRSLSGKPRPSEPRSPRSPSTPGSTSITPTAASPRSPRPAMEATG